ncbi:importin 13 [Mucor ambiguus]|uniref:Importin 13 n=1 Tax=Mucor ambiguus TaxID=91626 RepID=A0A0C9M4H9_9FUNG|nr:importin 13 [Mucor ambiguus]
MAATALDDVQQDMATKVQQLPPLDPLLITKIPKDITTVKSKSSMSHFKRCSGHKTRKGGGQCTRLVKINLEQAEEAVYCYNHLPKSHNVKHSSTINKKVALRKQPTDHAKQRETVKQSVARLTQEELQQSMDKVHDHGPNIETQNEEDSSATIEKVKSRRRRVDHAKEKAIVEQPVNRLAHIELRQSKSKRASHGQNLKLQNKEHAPAIIEKVALHEHLPGDANEIVKQPVIHDCWQLWIGGHIAPKRKALIRQVMKDPISDRDKAGYIYGFLLEDGPRVSQVEHAYFKIGRAENPQRRMYQVARSCNFIPKIVEVIPKFPEKPSAQDKECIMPANVDVDVDANEKDDDSNAMETKCPMSHRVERLIHLELASQYQRAGFKCDECGSTHREWFRVDRKRHPNGKLMTDQELWHSDIRPIVLKWIQFGVVATALKS